MRKRPKIGLALGGGARGVAHIGILKVFEQEKIPIDCSIKAEKKDRSLLARLSEECSINP